MNRLLPVTLLLLCIPGASLARDDSGCERFNRAREGITRENRQLRQENYNLRQENADLKQLRQSRTRIPYRYGHNGISEASRSVNDLNRLKDSLDRLTR